MHHFTPIASLIGGILIGPSASAMLWFDDKITGVSGIVAGLLVGFDTRLGNGCTSGHGVSRLSARSSVATGTFLATGALTVFDNSDRLHPPRACARHRP